MLRALERFHLGPDRLQRLLAAVDRVLDEASGVKSPWTDEARAESEALAHKWLERARKRRAARAKAQGSAEAQRPAEGAGLAEQGQTTPTTPAGRAVATDAFSDEDRAGLFEDMSDETAATMDAAATRVASGEISPREFEMEMEWAIWRYARAAFLAGKVVMGGPDQVSRAEEREIQRWGNLQVNRLHRFVAEIRAGQQSEAQIKARAQLYAKALRAPYNKGAARAFGDLHLPQVPGDGKTQCRTNCKCELEYQAAASPDGPVLVKVYWRLHPAEHCSDCLDLAKMDPFFQVEV